MKTKSKFNAITFTQLDEKGVEYSKCRCGHHNYSEEEFSEHVKQVHSDTTLEEISH